MSFILDALRKSDAERQRQSAPGLADIRYARPKARRSPWVPLLVIVLGGNLAFMALQWWRGGTARPAAAPGAVVAPPAMPVAPAVPATTVAALPRRTPPTARAAPPPDVRPLAGEADPTATEQMSMRPDPVDDPDLAGIDDGLAASADMDATTLAAWADAGTASATPPRRSRIREEAGLPTSQQLIAAGTLRVPELTLELHVYSDDPARRFVIINGRRYREGAALNEGLVVESITAEGAVLDSQGTRFIVLPR
jgi:general secretion pathway protein B